MYIGGTTSEGTLTKRSVRMRPIGGMSSRVEESSEDRADRACEDDAFFWR